MLDVMHKLSVDEVVAHTPDAIWSALTDEDAMQRWMMRPSSFAPVVGTRFVFQTTPAGAWDGTIQCEVLEVIANERLVYSWQSGHPDNVGYGSDLNTIVTWTLSQAAQGTRIRMLHAGFVLPKNEVAFKNLGEGWKKVVANLATVAGEIAATHPCCRQFAT